MNYTIINNNPKNFKVSYVMNGKPQCAVLSQVSSMVYVRIGLRINVTINPYGKIYGDGEELTQHTMSEEALFQNSLIDPLCYEKKVAAEILTAYYNNSNEMTVELIDLVLNPTEIEIKTAVKTKTKKK